MADKFRTIIHTERFERELAAIEPDVQRTDEFLAGIEWIVARTPGAGLRSGTSSVWTLNFEIDDGRSVTMYYSFNTKYVYFLSITLVKASPY